MADNLYDASLECNWDFYRYKWIIYNFKYYLIVGVDYENTISLYNIPDIKYYEIKDTNYDRMKYNE